MSRIKQISYNHPNFNNSGTIVFLVGIITVLILSSSSNLSLPTTSAVSVYEDLRISGQEKAALDEFRKRASTFVPHDYMKEDIYLIRWLRARNLNIKAAEQMLKENLKWRKENNMDTILEEDFSEMDRDYPYQIHLKDKEGKPIATCNFGDWDIRKMAVTGQLPRLYRYVDRGFERLTRSVRELQAQGKLVTQWNFIMNMDNYNMVQHGCIQCIPYYLYLISTYENHFPMHADKIIAINTPTMFEIALNAMMPLMSPITRKTFKVYNTDKSHWQAELFKTIDKNELPIEYGGTREV